MPSASPPTPRNVHEQTVRHFGEEWSIFSQERGWEREDGLSKMFDAYFAALPDGALNASVVAGDFGAGSGRWASLLAPRVKRLYVLEPSTVAMGVARRNLAEFTNITFIEEPIGGPSSPAGSLDLAYSLGVIHHMPDSLQALKDIRATLKPGGFFVGYLYYALENRPRWYRAVWRSSDLMRARISRLPIARRRFATDVLAGLVYWPLARIARLLARCGVDTAAIPLSAYSDKSFYVMRNDALDRFGTPLEKRFTREELRALLMAAGYDVKTLVFSPNPPYWCLSVRNVGAPTSVTPK